jgi:hypothetical protein
MFCHTCGTQVANEAQFCYKCGQAFASPATPPLGATPPLWSTPPLSSAPWVAPVRVIATPGKWIGEAWTLVTQDLGNYLLMALIFSAVSSVPFIQGTLIAGFHIYTIKRMMGRRAEFGDLFKGFNFFLPTLVASLLIGLFTFVGMLACLVGGLVVAGALNFTYLFIVDKRMDFWPAMQSSHAVVKNDYFGFTMFALLLLLVNCLGALCLVVGLLVTFPVSIAAITVAYREIVGFDQYTVDAL